LIDFVATGPGTHLIFSIARPRRSGKKKKGELSTREGIRTAFEPRVGKTLLDLRIGKEDQRFSIQRKLSLLTASRGS
jgi:hypothetical protein